MTAKKLSIPSTEPMHQLTGLRGVAAILVVLDHVSNAVIGRFSLGGKIRGVRVLPFAFAGGNVGVMIFFTLSGFLMGHLYYNTPFLEQARGYVAARVLRVLPLYYLAFTFIYIPVHILIDPPERQVMLCEYPIPTSYGCPSITNGLALLENSFVPLWTVPAEIHFYGLFALMWYLRWACAKCHLVHSSLLIGVLYAVSYHVRPLAIHYTLHLFLTGTVLGVHWLPRVSRWCSAQDKKLQWAGPLSLAFVMCAFDEVRGWKHLLLWPATVLGYSNQFAAHLDPLNLVATVTVLLAAANNTHSTSILRQRILLFLGRISYGIYVFHKPLLVPFDMFEQDSSALVYLLVMPLLTCACASGSFHLLEKPLMKLRKTASTMQVAPTLV